MWKVYKKAAFRCHHLSYCIYLNGCFRAQAWNLLRYAKEMGIPHNYIQSYRRFYPIQILFRVSYYSWLKIIASKYNTTNNNSSLSSNAIEKLI